MPPVRFEPTVSAGERPQTYALDRVATGTGSPVTYCYLKFDTVDYTPEPQTAETVYK